MTRTAARTLPGSKSAADSSGTRAADPTAADLAAADLTAADLTGAVGSPAVEERAETGDRRQRWIKQAIEPIHGNLKHFCNIGWVCVIINPRGFPGVDREGHDGNGR